MRVRSSFAILAHSVLVLVAMAMPSHAARPSRAQVESDPHFTAWAAALEPGPATGEPGCATSETLETEQLRRHRLRERLLASLAARGFEPTPPPDGYGPWPWAFIASSPASPALVDSGDTALLVDDGKITYLNRELQPEVDPFEAARAFYAGHHDEYDFLVVFTNFPTMLAGRRFLAYHQAVANDATGLGYAFVRSDELFNDATSYTHKAQPGRLQSLVHMNDIRAFPADPAAVYNGRYSATTLLGHEVGHRWLARVRLEYPNVGPSLILLGRQSSHWSFFLHSGASPVEGNAWASGGTTFSTLDAPLSYGLLDLYLMGMLGTNEIPGGALWYVDTPSDLQPPVDEHGASWGRGSAPTPGVTCVGQQVEFGLQDVTLTNGLRLPAYPDAPRDFRVAFALIVSDISTATADDLQKLETLRSAFRTWFQSATLGRGSIDTELRRVPARVVFTHRAHGDVEDASSPIPIVTSIRLEPWSLPTRLEDIAVSLFWSVDGGPFTETAMASPTLGELTATIPAPPSGSTVRYWLRATSNIPDHVHTLPEAAPDSVYSFRMRPDGAGPTLQHAARIRWSRLAEPPLLRALVRDTHGVGEVWVEYRVAGGTVATQTMPAIGTTDLYETRLVLPGRLGDTVEYRILARDVAAAPHVTSSPASGWHSIQLTRSLFEDAEKEDPMWTHRSLLYGRPDQWHREFVGAITGLYSWKVGPTNNTLPGHIASRQDAVLESPAIDAFPGGKLVIQHRWALLPDEFAANYAVDGGIVEWQDVVRDGPADKWWLLDPDAGYTHTMSPSVDNALSGYPVFAGTEPFPIRDPFTFPAWVVNRKIRLRFRVATSSPLPRWPSLDGWVIDDIEIDPGPPPTPVTLEAVTASRRDSGVHVAWAADAAEGDVFVVARAELAGSGEPPRTPPAEIARIESAPGRRAYEHFDTAAARDRDYLYRVALWNAGVEIAAQEARVGAIRRFVLHPNVPNPFNPTTRIAFEIPARGRVRILIHDVRGRLVRRLADGVLDAGRHELDWDGTDGAGRGVASGVYLLRLESAGRSAERRLVLAR